VLRDGVRQHRVREARRRDREEGEEDEADRTRDQHCVAQKPIAVASITVERDSDSDDHRPVTPDVDPVRDRRERLVRGDRLLERPLPVQMRGVLEPHQALGVLVRGLRAAGSEISNAEIGEGGEGSESDLTKRPGLQAPHHA
jgi:hypothetical protein